MIPKRIGICVVCDGEFENRNNRGKACPACKNAYYKAMNRKQSDPCWLQHLRQRKRLEREGYTKPQPDSDRGKSLDQMAREAREHGMSYGQYMQHLAYIRENKAAGAGGE